MLPTSLTSLFSNRNFAIFIGGNILSLIGTWIQIVTIAWLTWELTESTFWLGIMAMAQLLPTLILTPWAGVLADRYERRTVVFWAQSCACVITLVLFALYEFDMLTIVWLFAAKASISGFLSLSQPARMAMTPDLVRDRDLPTAIAFGSITFSVARFIGPAIAGVIISFGDIGWAFLINAVSFMALLIAVSLLRLPAQDSPTTAQRRGAVYAIGEGMTYVRHHPGLIVLFGFFLLRVLTIGSISQFFAAFSDLVLGRGPEGLALLTSSAGCGSLLGGLWMARQKSAAGLTTALCAGALLSALMVVGFCMTTDMTIAMAVIGLYSAMTTLSYVAGQTLTQIAAAPSMRGRVMSFWALLDRGGPALGAFAMGIWTEAFGLTLPFLYGAVIMGAAALVIWTGRPRLARALAAAESAVQAETGARPRA